MTGTFFRLWSHFLWNSGPSFQKNCGLWCHKNNIARSLILKELLNPTLWLVIPDHGAVIPAPDKPYWKFTTTTNAVTKRINSTFMYDTPIEKSSLTDWSSYVISHGNKSDVRYSFDRIRNGSKLERIRKINKVVIFFWLVFVNRACVDDCDPRVSSTP